MRKEYHKYADCLSYILREIKGANGCDGATIAQLKKIGIKLPNATQINVYEMPEMNGLSIAYPEYLNAVFCADLHYLNIYDFNRLVKVVSELSDNGYCYL